MIELITLLRLNLEKRGATAGRNDVNECASVSQLTVDGQNRYQSVKSVAYEIRLLVIC